MATSTIGRIVQAASTVGLALIMMAASVNASTITYNTNAAGTKFVGGTLVLNSNVGAAATLTYVPNVSSTSGVPSNIDLGDFLLACPSCGTQLQGAGSFFNAFSFDLVITDTTDGATGMFVGTSTGGSVWSNVSQITINWLPLILGPGGTNALTGNFGTTYFTTTTFTGIAAPNSGTPAGDTTVQGTVNSSAVPEPASFGLIGAGLLGLGILGRKRFARR
jgi:hypothetical protein